MKIRSKTKTFVMTLLVLNIYMLGTSVQQASGLSTYIVQVKWEGWDFSNDNDCGDGVSNNCEMFMQIKYSTSSCSSLTTWEGNNKVISPGSQSSSNVYSFSYSRVGGWPCLKFKVQFWEADGGGSYQATDQYSLTATSTLKTSYLDLTIGSANGYFDITYKKYSIPFFGPESP